MVAYEFQPVPNLHRIRTGMPMSVSELARRTGLSRQAIIDLEAERNGGARASTVRRLADALHTAPAVLVDGHPYHLFRMLATGGDKILWDIRSSGSPNSWAWIPVSRIPNADSMAEAEFDWREAVDAGTERSSFPEWLRLEFGAELLTPLD